MLKRLKGAFFETGEVCDDLGPFITYEDLEDDDVTKILSSAIRHHTKLPDKNGEWIEMDPLRIMANL